MLWKTIRANLGVGLALAASIGMWTIPSFAAIPGLERVIDTTINDSSDLKIASALCPPGKKLLSPSGRVSGGESNITILEMSPAIGASGATVIAVEHAAYEGNWSITAEAVCADPLPGLEFVTASTSFTANQQKSVTVPCPMGKNILGAGFDLNPASFRGEDLPRVTSLSIHPQIRAATIRALLINPLHRWGVEAHAVCADPLPGLERHLVGTTYSLNIEQVALAQCTPPKRAAGSGFRIEDATGLANFVETYTCCGTSPTVALARARRPPNFSLTPWRITSYVTCASP